MSQNNVVRIMCPNLACQRVLGVPVEARGKLVRCRNCGMTVRVPTRKEIEPRDASQGPQENSAAA